MWSRVFIFLFGAVILYQVITADIYVAELMVESNVTLDTQVILDTWPPQLDLPNIPALLVSREVVTADWSVGSSCQATELCKLWMQELELQAGFTYPALRNCVASVKTKSVTTARPRTDQIPIECLVIGLDYSCNCSEGYAWSNTMCYTYGCCNDTTCTQNVTLISPLCVPKVNVRLTGSVHMPSTFTQTDELHQAFLSLNGLEDMKVTVRPSDSKIGDFELAANVAFNTSKVQEIVNTLQTSITPEAIYIDTHGMVQMYAPNGSVDYKSTQTLRCTFEEMTGSAGWNLTKGIDRFDLNNGQLVEIKPKCEGHPSCVEVILKSVTGIWEGTYECGFTIGSIRHTARYDMKVALLPDKITLTIDPLVVDCSQGDESVPVIVTATIPNTTAEYDIEWSYKDPKKTEKSTPAKNTFTFSQKISILCGKAEDPYSVKISFQNNKKQETSAQVDIPVISDGAKVCEEDTTNGDIWPKTPSGTTLINRTCSEDRVGYRTRTCDKQQWQDVFSNCVDKALQEISNTAENFLNGLGASEKVAEGIFEGMKNKSQTNSNSSDDVADINASVDILETMANASKNFELQENVFPDLVNAASNMLNSTWSGVNDTILHGMSSKYLFSLEKLVKNIKVNMSNGFNSTNLELIFCSGAECNVSAFDIDVNLNKTEGTLKVMAVKNLMHKLKNNFRETERTDLLLSATLVNKSNSNISIKLAFPDFEHRSRGRFCVFWNTTIQEWSDIGCTRNYTDDNRTICECNHLTSFAILMAKGEISDEHAKSLSIITTVGLAVSICSLLIFLIIESMVWSAVIKTNLSHFRHTAIVNIAMFRLLGDCSFLASTNPKILPSTWCLVLAACKHLFYLAMFTWMLCLSTMLVHQLIFVFSPLRKRVFMFLSSILGYVLPMLLVGASYVYYRYTKKDYHNKDTCWLVYEGLLVGSIHAFILPVGTIVLANLFSMVVVIITLMKTSVPDSSKADEKETAKSILKVVVFLTPVFGVTWAIGFFLQMLDEDNPMYEVAFYSFTILNSLQGLFILLTGCVAEQKVREELMKIIREKSGRRSESTQKLTSTTYTKDK